MAILTTDEFWHTKLGCVDDVIYNRIEREFRRVLGDKARVFLQRHWNKTIAEISANSLVNIMGCFTLI